MAKQNYEKNHRLGVQLRQARSAAGLTQSELASRLGKDQSFVSRYEEAERTLSGVDLHDVLMALDLDPTDFFVAFDAAMKAKPPAPSKRRANERVPLNLTRHFIVEDFVSQESPKKPRANKRPGRVVEHGGAQKSASRQISGRKRGRRQRGGPR